MFESPLLAKMIAATFHKCILALLEDRFATVPDDVVKSLQEVLNQKKLRKLAVLAVKCPDLQAFRKALPS